MRKMKFILAKIPVPPRPLELALLIVPPLVLGYLMPVWLGWKFGQQDYRYYQMMQRGEMALNHLPAYTRITLAPIGIIPYWCYIFFSTAVILFICRKERVNPIAIFLSFQAVEQLMLGQMGGYMLIGATLIIYSGKWQVKSLGLCILMTKPHLAWLLAILEIKKCPKVIIGPVAILILSVILYGNWLPIWINYMISGAANGSLVSDWLTITRPMLILLPIMLTTTLLYSGKLTEVEAMIIGSAVPWTGAYSHLVWLIFFLGKESQKTSVFWWTILSWGLMLIYPFKGVALLPYFAWAWTMKKKMPRSL